MKGRAILLQTKYFCGNFDNNNYKYIYERITSLVNLIISLLLCTWYGLGTWYFMENINYNFTYILGWFEIGDNHKFYLYKR